MTNSNKKFRVRWKGVVRGPFADSDIQAQLRRGEIGLWVEISENEGSWISISKHPSFAPKPSERVKRQPYERSSSRSADSPKPQPNVLSSKVRIDVKPPKPDPTIRSKKVAIECFKGPDFGKKILLTPNESVLVGCHDNATVQSHDPQLHQSGFELAYDAELVYFQSLSDQPGFLDGVSKSKGILRFGEQLRFGNSWWMLEADAAEINLTNSEESYGFIRSLSDNVSRIVGVQKIEGLNFGKILSQVFSHHTHAEMEEKFVCGTSTTTPPLSDVKAAWPEPWLFVRMIVLTAVLCGGFFYGIYRFDNPLLIPGFLFVASFGIPMSTLILFWEAHIIRNVSFFQVGRLVLLGGLISIITSLYGFEFTNLSEIIGPPAAGVVEEAAKLIVVIFLMHRYTKYSYIQNGLLFGAAVGAGFAAFETAGYIFVLSTSEQDALVIAFIRGIFSPFAHIVWTAAAAAALWRVKGAERFSFGMLFDLGFLRVIIAVMCLHALWNLPLIELGFDDFLYELAKLVAIGLVGWIIVLSLYQESLKQILSHQQEHTK